LTVPDVQKPVETPLFPGPVLVAAPHMDDATLACGGTLQKLPDRETLHILYCTRGNGARAGPPPPPARNPRRAEARAALETLGLDPQGPEFLDYVDWRLRRRPELQQRLQTLVETLRPRWVFAPFRYDRHPDHIAVYRAARRAVARARAPCSLVEYFVYFQWRLLPRRDIRSYIRAPYLLTVDIGDVVDRKRRALQCFASQLRADAEHRRPVLSPELIEAFCRPTEQFLLAEPPAATREVLALPPLLMQALHVLEPRLKFAKERLQDLLWRARR